MIARSRSLGSGTAIVRSHCWVASVVLESTCGVAERRDGKTKEWNSHQVSEQTAGPDDLAERLKKHGFKETKASIANKLARATLPAHFFLASLVAMGREHIVLAEI